MKSRILLSVLFFFLVLSSNGQIQRCGTDEHQAALDLAFPELKKQRTALNEAADRLILENPEFKAGLVVTIPVVFHVLYTNTAQNIPDNRLFEQIDVLNKDYSRTNVDAINTRSMFLPVAANTQIQFCLAQRTPTGTATDGIVRVSYTGSFPNNPHTVSPEWDHTKYLNIYIGDLGGGLLGYANLPPGSTGNDHVVALYSAVGGPNVPGTISAYDLGRTITHEVGHWLNLQHTFNSGCVGTSANNCATSGDFICDTPPTANPAFGCPTNTPNTCTEVTPFPPPYTANMVDMYENYMDYTDDNCMNIFSLGQSTRMNAAITTLRSQLLTSLGCVPVGVNEILDPSFITISPTISNGKFEVQFNFPAATSVSLELMDMGGRKIYDSIQKIAYSSTINIDLSDKAEGVYMLRASTEKGFLVKRIVIVK
ncbi:MAG: T9SS type A sorting domain-containing protein [Bacteroidetes bacterium]|nr:T9SS type A sorting domain-containing protein [Bacteroidota bacterium]